MDIDTDRGLHGAACGCGHDHGAPAAARRPASGWGAALLPALACAVCPACLTTYAKVLSVFGLSIGVDAALHERLLFAALGASLAISAWRSWRRRRAWPLGVALAGASLVGLGHALGEQHVLEWGGMLVLLAGAWAEHFRLRRRALAAA